MNELRRKWPFKSQNYFTKGFKSFMFNPFKRNNILLCVILLCLAIPAASLAEGNEGDKCDKVDKANKANTANKIVEQIAEQTIAIRMLEYSNKLRIARGLKPHLQSDKCDKISQDWSDYMARTGSFRHGGGENIIAYFYPTNGKLSDKDIARIFGIWMNSRPHRAFILSSSKYAGYGLSYGRNGRVYASGTFR